MKKIIISVVMALLIFPVCALGINWTIEVKNPQGELNTARGTPNLLVGKGFNTPTPTKPPDTSPNPDCGPGKKYQAGHTYEESASNQTEGWKQIIYHECTVWVRCLGKGEIHKTLSPNQTALFECGLACPDKIWGQCKQEQKTQMGQFFWRKTFSNECKATYTYFKKEWVRSVYLNHQLFNACDPHGSCTTVGAVFCGNKRLKLCRTGEYLDGEKSTKPECLYKFCSY